MLLRHARALGLFLALLTLITASQPDALAQPEGGWPVRLPPPARDDAELLDLPRMEKDGKGKDGDREGDDKDRKRKPELDLLPQSYPGGLYPAIPVTLPEVLKLAVLANLDVAQANIAVERARLGVLRARAQFLPNLQYGVQYQGHDGTIQKTEGNIIDIDRDSLFVGGGPQMVLPLSRALYGPGQARNLLEAARFGQGRVTLETLNRVIDAYFNVLRARRQMARLDEVLEMLTSEEESELRGQSKGLLPLIKAFVLAGTALPSDQARVEADVVRRHGERIRALEDVRTSSAELSRLLHLNAAYFLLPVEDYRFPLDVPGAAWFETPVEGLLTQALSARPELGENQALIAAAVLRYKEAKYQPLLPSFQAGLSWGGFGGGPQLVRNPKGTTFFGNSGNIKDFDVRADLDVAVVWRLENMGVGNLAQIRDANLQRRQAEVQLRFQQDLIVAQVVQTMEGVQRGRSRYHVYRAGLFDDAGQPVGAVYRSLRLNFLRIRQGQGLPLEVLDSTRRLSDVLQGYADTISDYDRSRYRLLVALGLPPESIVDPSCMPLPAGAPHPALPPAQPAPAVAPPPPARPPAPPVGRGKADEVVQARQAVSQGLTYPPVQPRTGGVKFVGAVAPLDGDGWVPARPSQDVVSGGQASRPQGQ